MTLYLEKKLNQSINIVQELYRDKISVYDEHPKAGQNTQPFHEINKVMCNM